MLVKWFRKNRNMFSGNHIRFLLTRKDGSASPILEALGGPSWLEDDEVSDEYRRRFNQFCFNCFGREPMVTLSLCARCRKIYYWWETHFTIRVEATIDIMQLARMPERKLGFSQVGDGHGQEVFTLLTCSLTLSLGYYAGKYAYVRRRRLIVTVH